MQPGSSKLTISSDEIHLWFVNPEQITDPKLLDAYYPLLSEEEKVRQKRFIFEKHQHQYLITRALVRTVLSKYCDVAPQDWKFGKNSYGRPFIDEVHNQNSLRFNLTHTDGLIVCALTLDKDLGVDVEDEFRKSETTGIAHRFFAPEEVQNLNEQPQNEQKSRFFDFWTLKESYIKACGMGLAIPLGHFSFDLSQKSKIGISFVTERKDNPGDWQFWLFKPNPLHKVAVGIRCDVCEKKYHLTMRSTVPFQSDEIVSYPLLRGQA
ncbi:MAG: 4'-phosphopantetheinyl transferase superfamily protein [Proteobacteria bacterium]|nr:4'-phosphopantetheinyl transferase superfamily protein [Pseudomonadota bacterium]